MAAAPLPRTGRRLAIAAAIVAFGTACGDDATGVPLRCEDATRLQIGETVEGTLATGDARFAGAFVDYFAVHVTRSRRLMVTMASTEVDPLVLVFGDEGTVVQQAFQPVGSPPGTLETASLARAFAPGCTLLGASSWVPRAEGAYTVAVEPDTTALMPAGR
ncbi:MAG: hypothetical protein R3314_03235 [Longimicrobiales bacterium]|nr:hypothetical protein [Longimicrobiales bacterium]